jgi:hypothetical protein
MRGLDGSVEGEIRLVQGVCSARGAFVPYAAL